MIALIRHGKTKGNVCGRYVGRTDEGLCEHGVAELLALRYPPVSRVFASPMRRCIETAGIIYPDAALCVISDFREIDFGEFEYRNYSELSSNPVYQAWIDSKGEMPFPMGESKASFSARCVRAFEEILPLLANEYCALVVHGGTIMAIMERFAEPRLSYYDYQTKNGRGFLAELAGSGGKPTLRVISPLP